jgi:hypothetical protein
VLNRLNNLGAAIRVTSAILVSSQLVVYRIGYSVLGIAGCHAVEDVSNGYGSPAYGRFLDGYHYAGGEEVPQHLRQLVVDNLLDEEC